MPLLLAVNARVCGVATFPASLNTRAVFCAFVEGKILQLPWCESLSNETGVISQELLLLNRAGFLSINSQPSVNGKPSDDAVFGWGGSGGYVYQKAYIEFFCLPEQFERLVEVLRSFKSITYNAVNRAGEQRSNYEGCTHVNAVTWGVFPGREIVQPTVVDSESFQIWKDEAFSLWGSKWQRLYDSSSRPFQLLQECMDCMMLVNLVENDYMNGNIFAPFHRLGI
jgi:methylenetetrahydrofolate reductase (NADPH)